MCRLYGVTRAGYYAWRSRGKSERARRNEQLAERMPGVAVTMEFMLLSEPCKLGVEFLDIIRRRAGVLDAEMKKT